MREIRTSGSEGGGVETNRCSLPLSQNPCPSILMKHASRVGKAKRAHRYASGVAVGTLRFAHPTDCWRALSGLVQLGVTSSRPRSPESNGGAIDRNLLR